MACEVLFPSPSRPVTQKDISFSFLIWFFVVAFWCGSWRLIEEYFLKGEDYYSAWVLTPVAATICVIISCCKPVFYSLLKGREDTGYYMIATRLFTYIWAVAYMFEWVGVWNLINIYHGKGWEKSLIWFAICMALALLFRFSSTALRSPAFIRLDDRPKYFKSYSLFSCPPYLVVCFILDVMCTHYILLPVVIGIWRGFWNVLADWVFPDDKVASHIVCLVVGLAILIIMAILQFIFAKVAEDLEENGKAVHKVISLLIEDFYHIILLVGTIAAWRGCWMILQTYIFPDTLFGGWMCHVLGFGALILLKAASTVVGEDIVVDGSKKQGKGILWDVDYTEFFKLEEQAADYVKISWI